MLRTLLSRFSQVSLPSSLCLAPLGGIWAVVTTLWVVARGKGAQEGPDREVPSATLQQPSRPPLKALSHPMVRGRGEHSDTARGSRVSVLLLPLVQTPT